MSQTTASTAPRRAVSAGPIEGEGTMAPASSMTAAEFAVIQHRLGLTLNEIADLLGVNSRTAVRWAGNNPYGPGATHAETLRGIINDRDKELRKDLRRAHNSPTRPVVLTRYSSPEAVTAHTGHSSLRAQDAYLAELMAALTSQDMAPLVAPSETTAAEFAVIQHRLGLTLEELADLVGVHGRTTRRWAGNNPEGPGGKHLETLRGLIADRDSQLRDEVRRANEAGARPVMLTRYGSAEAVAAHTRHASVRAQDAYLAELVAVLSAQGQHPRVVPDEASAEQPGPRKTRTRLSDEQVQAMREASAAGALRNALAEEYGVDPTMVGRIVRGKTRAAAGGPIQS